MGKPRHSSELMHVYFPTKRQKEKAKSMGFDEDFSDDWRPRSSKLRLGPNRIQPVRHAVLKGLRNRTKCLKVYSRIPKSVDDIVEEVVDSERKSLLEPKSSPPKYVAKSTISACLKSGLKDGVTNIDGGGGSTTIINDSMQPCSKKLFAFPKAKPNKLTTKSSCMNEVTPSVQSTSGDIVTSDGAFLGVDFSSTVNELMEQVSKIAGNFNENFDKGKEFLINIDQYCSELRAVAELLKL